MMCWDFNGRGIVSMGMICMFLCQSSEGIGCSRLEPSCIRTCITLGTLVATTILTQERENEY